jgi:hypothetical protein
VAWRNKIDTPRTSGLLLFAMFKRVTVILIVCILLVCACVLFVRRGALGNGPAKAAQPVETVKPVSTVEHSAKKKMSAAENAKRDAALRRLQALPLGQAILEAEKAISAGGSAKEILADLRDKFEASGNTAASAAIVAYLESGRDVSTGLPFVVGENGAMVSDPTMRTYLLDLLLTTDPKAALAEAEIVFDAKDSADEYAICLRNVGKLDTSDDGRAYVGKRALELLSDANLAANPTAGFAEAFDAVVYGSSSGSAFPTLSRYTDKDLGLVLNMPAFMALDRMTLDDTSAALSTLLTDSSLLADRPLSKASLFARADLADSTQLGDAEQYVLSLKANGEVADYYFGMVPNLNYTVADGLLTDRAALSNDYVTERSVRRPSATV